MAKRIESLTAAQEAMFGEYVERWTAIGLSTAPADRSWAEDAIRDAYRLSGRDVPERVVWCGSPLGQALTRAIVIQHDSVRDSVWDSVGVSVRDSVRDSVWGQYDAAWIAFYAFFREQCGLIAETDRLAGLRGVCESAGWWLPHERICWVSERHNVCRLDDRQRIHSDTGPAIQYPDGWAIWAWHGVRVPQQVIESPDSLDPAKILAEQNAEVRRVMMERFGPDRLIRETSAEVVDDDPEHGTLYRLPVDDDEPLVMVKVVNSTREPDGSSRDYWLRVPPDMDTAANAVAWTFAETADTYRVVAAS